MPEPRSSLDQFIAQIRAAQIRGLPITADDVLLGLEHAIAEKRPGSNNPVRFELGADFAENRCRTRCRMLALGELEALDRL